MIWDKTFSVRFQEEKEIFISTASRTYSEVDRVRTENSSLDSKGLLRKTLLWSQAEVKILGPTPVLHNVFTPWCLIKHGVTLSILSYLQFSQFHRASWYYSSSIYPTEHTTRLFYKNVKTCIKFTLKCSYTFRFNNHLQGAYFSILLKL